MSHKERGRNRDAEQQRSAQSLDAAKAAISGLIEPLGLEPVQGQEGYSILRCFLGCPHCGEQLTVRKVTRRKAKDGEGHAAAVMLTCATGHGVSLYIANNVGAVGAVFEMFLGPRDQLWCQSQPVNLSIP